MASILKVDTIQDQAGNNIISENANVITIGASGDTITVPAGATVSGFTSAGIDDNATSTAITINSSGRVGINESSPSSLLELKQSVDNSTASGLQIRNTANTSSIFIYQNGSHTVYDSGSAGDQYFKTGLSERMRITSSGDVGIGDTTPGAKLDVRSQINVTNVNGVSLQGLTGTRYGYSTAYRTILLGSTGTGTSKNIAIGYDPSSNASGNFAGNGTEILFPNTVSFMTPNSTDDNYIRPVIQLKDGTVGINESTPLGKFHIRDGDSATTSVDSLADELVVENSGSGGMTILTPASSTGNIFFGDPNSNSIGRVQYTHSSNAMLFATNGTERMRIDSTGSVGIGTTAPFNSNAGNFTISNTNPAIFFEDTNSSSYGVGRLIFSNGILSYLVGSRNGTGTSGSSEFFRINSSGQTLIGTTVAPTNADTKLMVHTPISSSSRRVIEMSHNTTGANKPGAALGLSIDNGGESTNAATLTFATASGGSLSERMRINSSGKVLVNTTSNGTESNLNVGGQFGLSAGRGFVFEKQDGANGSYNSVTLQFTTGANGRTCFIETMVGSSGYYLYHVSHRYRGDTPNVLVNQGNGPTISWSVSNSGSNTGSVYTYVVNFPSSTSHPYAKFKVSLGGYITTPITSTSLTFA